MKQEKGSKEVQEEILFLKREIKKLQEENKATKIRIERKNLELQKYWLKALGL
ncbi:MAG TPA: hypothetical protein IAB35_03320 [Candidatus Faecimonas gallistercoris]|nr:hypothetical protein [Candidatus Faecimonas gallistercoris]